MSKKAPLTFLTLFYGLGSLLSVLTRNATTVNEGHSLSREGVAIIIMSILGFCIFIIPVLKALSAIGGRGAIAASSSCLLIAVANIAPHQALATYLGDTVFDFSMLPGIAIMIGVCAFVMFVFVMAIRRPLPLEAPF